MAPVNEFHSTGDEDRLERKYHNQSECPFGRTIIRNGHYVPGRGAQEVLCAYCEELALEGSYLFARTPLAG